MPDARWPIVIRLTPPGRGAVATLRVEGTGAVEAVAGHLCGLRCPLRQVPVDRPTLGHFGGQTGEQVVVHRRGDGSVELHCHGGDAAVGMVQQRLVDAGAQAARWQDWAAGQHDDAFVAEARRALADAPTLRTAAILLDQYHGALRRAIAEIERLRRQGDPAAAAALAQALLGRADLGRHLIAPWKVVLAGQVNVGKSSLINRIAGYDRAIVHPTPGTTRDVVTVETAIDGWPVELADTAGIRRGNDELEQAGIDRARAKLAEADLAILVSEASQAWSAAEGDLLAARPDAVVVYNKSDLPAAPGFRRAGMAVSALTGAGIEALLRAVADRLVPTPPAAGAAVPHTPLQVETVSGLATS